MQLKYTCDKCGKIANSKQAHECHIYAIHKKKTISKECETCKEHFVTDKYHTLKNMNIDEIVISQ